MGYAQDLVNAGYIGYQGWGDAEAAADYNATGGAGKAGGGGGGSSSGGNISPFSFNYEEAAKQAFGELAPYYDRLLTESKGNLNLVLARLTEDYDRGLRFKAEDTTFNKETLNIQQANTTQNVMDNALSRGLYQRSAFEPITAPTNTGFGIPDTELAKRVLPIQRSGQRLDVSANRFRQTSTIAKDRSTFDAKKKQDLYEFELGERRKKESVELANIRGDKAYREWASKATLV